MPPSLREWLPANHLAWFVLSSVEAIDLAPFYASYRSDGHGRPAHDPAMMVALLLYAYCKGQRSSRVIVHECVEDIAYRVIAANELPDLGVVRSPSLARPSRRSRRRASAAQAARLPARASVSVALRRTLARPAKRTRTEWWPML